MNFTAGLCAYFIVVSIEYLIVKHPPLLHKGLVLLVGLAGGAAASMLIPQSQTVVGIILMVLWSLCRMLIYGIEQLVLKTRVNNAKKRVYNNGVSNPYGQRGKGDGGVNRSTGRGSRG